MTKNAERDAAIVAMVLSRGEASYRDVAASIGVTKGVVSAVMFRHNKSHDSHADRDAVVRKIPYAGAER